MSPWGPVAPWWLVVAGCTTIVAVWHTSVLALLLELWRAWSPAAPARRHYAVAAAALACGVVLTIASPFILLAPPARVPTAAHEPVQRQGGTPPAGARRPTPAPRAMQPLPATTRRLPRIVEVALPWLGAIAMAGALVGAGRVAGGWALAHWIRRRATAVQSPEIADAARAVGAGWPLSGAALLASPHVDAPVVIGVRAPAILLPRDLERHLGADALSPLIAHELAHVRRRDYAANLAQSLADALLWFSPGARWISRRVREAREFCCDDVVAAGCGVGPYAAALTTLARLGAISPARPALNAVGPRLIVRIRRLLEGEGMTPFARYRLAGLLAACSLALAAGVAVIPASAAGAAQVSAGALSRWPVPWMFITTQQGAAVTLREVTPDDTTICGTVIVENRGKVPVSGLRFAAFAHPRGGSHDPTPEAIRTSDWLPVDVAAGATASVHVGLMTRADVVRIAGPDPQVGCALTEIRYANEATWRASPLVAFAPRPSEIPRALVGAPAPSNERICKDAEGLDYSHGAIVRIALDPGSLARCDGGRWTEYEPPGTQPGQAFVWMDLETTSGHRPSLGVEPGGTARILQWGLRPSVDAADERRVRLEVFDLGGNPEAPVATLSLIAGDPLTPVPGAPFSIRIRSTRNP